MGDRQQGLPLLDHRRRQRCQGHRVRRRDHHGVPLRPLGAAALLPAERSSLYFGPAVVHAIREPERVLRAQQPALRKSVRIGRAVVDSLRVPVGQLRPQQPALGKALGIDLADVSALFAAERAALIAPVRQLRPQQPALYESVRIELADVAAERVAERVRKALFYAVEPAFRIALVIALVAAELGAFDRAQLVAVVSA